MLLLSTIEDHIKLWGAKYTNLLKFKVALQILCEKANEYNKKDDQILFRIDFVSKIAYKFTKDYNLWLWQSIWRKFKLFVRKISIVQVIKL